MNDEMVMTLGSSHIPPMFFDGRIVARADADQFLKEGWLVYNASPTEIEALKALGGCGCFGDWKDTYKTMYGKEIRRIK